MTNYDNNKMMTSKQRLEMFQSSMDQLEQENEIKNVRQMLHQRYLQSKTTTEQQSNKSENEIKSEEKSTTEKKDKKIKIGRQMARIFRFENRLRNRRNHQPQAFPEAEDPMLNDPNVLFENFAFDHDDDDDDRPRPYFPDRNINDDDDDDSFRSLIVGTIRHLTWKQWSFWTALLTLYAIGQWQANRYEFGAPYLILSLLIFIMINLRRKSSDELSAYSVFNPNCQPIATVASHQRPIDEQTLLGLAPL